jgi:hypothetical protein
MRSERGQATIDYLGLTAVLAVLLAAAAGLAGGGAPGIANAVLGQVRHALCIVSGSPCGAERQAPCVVASERDARHVAVTILLVRLDGDRYVLREKLSDGTVRLTLGHRGGGGIELGVGGRARVKLKGRTLGIDDELRGGVEGVLGYGEVYVARDDREADEMLRALRRHVPLVGGDGPDPSERFVEGGTRGLARLGLGGSAAGASLESLSETVLAGRRNERTGNVTITLNAGSAGWALVSALMAGPAASSDRQVALALTLDRQRRPIELGLVATGAVAAGATLPTGIARRVGVRADDAQMKLRGRRWELGARLSLRDPGVAAAWAAFRHDPADAGAIRALAIALRTRSHVDVRTYAVESEAEGGAVGAGAGLRLGGELDHTTDRARLLAAATRPPGGLWEQRADCVVA